MEGSDSDDGIPLALLRTKCKGSETCRPTSHTDQAPIETQNAAVGSGSQTAEVHGPTDPIEKSFHGEKDGSTCQDNTHNMLIDSDSDSDEMSVCDYDSDRDPEFNPGSCEVRRCKTEVWAACTECEILLCYDHFMEDIASCLQHGKSTRESKKKTKHARALGRPFEIDVEMNVNTDAADRVQITETTVILDARMQRSVPEQFTVEGSEREVRKEREPRSNKQKEAKIKRNLGQEYTSVKTTKIVPAKHMKTRCKGETCAKQNKQCATVTDEQRQAIFDSYHSLGDLRLQREFLVRHVKVDKVKRKYTEGESRRNNTRQYMLTIGDILVTVCKLFFLNTLGISEQSARTALSKLTDTGTIETDKRGGRQSESERLRDAFLRKEISNHIDRFPKVESHYCRDKSSREYLSPDLTKRLMYNMFLQEWIPKVRPPSYTTYKAVLKSKHLSIHRPKKDKCSLCESYHQGNEETKKDLREMYETHVAEKDKVREIKDTCKQEAGENKNILCASFDLQQVIYLPISQDSAIFYKRRLSNYNLTFYNISSRDCFCFTWDETQSKRGSSEISTAVYRALKFYDDQGIKKAYLFADGCSGQNKNSIMPAMMLFALSKSTHLEEVSLRFFETNHGQNEGDSAHSAIGYKLKRAGDLFLPSQVATVISLARPQKPYSVFQMQSADFLDFKGLSKDLRILDARRGSDTEDPIHWNSIMELRVRKDQLDTVFFKTSHFDTEFKSLSLKRLKKSVKDHTLQTLNTGLTNISKEKHADLVALCSGPTPVIRLEEHKAFYRSLPHD